LTGTRSLEYTGDLEIAAGQIPAAEPTDDENTSSQWVMILQRC